MAALDGVNLYSAWHLNLDYSSVSMDDRSEVIRRCYWPILDLAASSGCPQGIELTGSTLSQIVDLDPDWISKFRDLIQAKLVEPIFSGQFQIVGPLAPSSVNHANITRGLQTFNEILGLEPALVFAHEQCVSEGYVDLLASRGFAAVILEWENTWLANPELIESAGYRPQKFGINRQIGIIWNHSQYFQGLQKFAHGELSTEDFVRLFTSRKDASPQAICFYGGDAETFNFRPKRFSSEAIIARDEWLKVEEAVGLSKRLGGQWVLPSHLLSKIPKTTIAPFSARHQIITKKQAKYNAVRWAVVGQNNYELNNYANLISSRNRPDESATPTSSQDDGLELWSSDLRTHIHPDRWAREIQAHPDLPRVSEKYSKVLWPKESDFSSTVISHRVQLESEFLRLNLDGWRGFTVESGTLLCPCHANLFGRLPFGSIAGPIPSPDWFSGNFVYREPGKPQITDLSAKQGTIKTIELPLAVHTMIDFQPFRLTKKVEISPDSPEITFAYRIDWNSESNGLIRAGYLSLNPKGWEWSKTHFFTENGGEKRFGYPVGGVESKHGDPVSMGVSATNCIGLAGGGFHLQDDLHRMDVAVGPENRGCALLLDSSVQRGTQLTRTSFTLQEIDDTFVSRNSVTTEFSFALRLSCNSPQAMSPIGDHSLFTAEGRAKSSRIRV